VCLDERSEIDSLKEQVKILRSNLEPEIEQRQVERKDHEAKDVSYEKIREESVRYHNNLHTKLDETIQQKALEEKQLLEVAHQFRRLQSQQDQGKASINVTEVTISLYLIHPSHKI
jgi:hypothetical protein